MGNNTRTSRRENVAVLNRAGNGIAVEGVELSDTGLVFATIDADTLARTGACLQKMGDCEDWWWGDYLSAYAQFRLEQENDAQALAAMDEGTKEGIRRYFIRNHVCATDGHMQPETLLDWYDVASFYVRGVRAPELSNTHHRVAMLGGGNDLAVAQNWLDRAKEERWSSNELRYEMRMAKRGAISDPPTTKVTVTQHELFGCQRWTNAQLKRVDQTEPDEIDAMLAEITKTMQGMHTLAQALAARRATLAGGGKESLSAAA